MKTFLFVSGIAMVSAGIFGAADLATDLKNGKLIEYDQKDLAKTKQTIIPEKKQVKTTAVPKTNLETKVAEAVATEKAEEKTEARSKKKKFRAELYSRGNPNIEEELIIEPDSAQKNNP